jgi:hypothetical protein
MEGWLLWMVLNAVDKDLSFSQVTATTHHSSATAERHRLSFVDWPQRWSAELAPGADCKIETRTG